MTLILLLIAFPLPVEGTEGFYAIEIIPFGEGVAAIGQSGSRLLVLDEELQPVLDLSADSLRIDWFRAIAADPFRGDLWVLTDDYGPFLFQFDRETLEPIDGYRFDDISNPVVDGTGSLWFSSDGSLFRDYRNLEIPLETTQLAVSADGGQVAWVDSLDRVWTANVSSLEPELMEDRRSMAPFYLPTSPVLVIPLLSGGFSIHLPDGSVTEIDQGEQPFWCPVPEGVVYCISSDDGHQVTESDLYVATLEGEIFRLTETPEAMEMNPSVFDEGVIAVDENNGYLVVIPDDCLFGLSE